MATLEKPGGEDRELCRDSHTCRRATGGPHRLVSESPMSRRHIFAAGLVVLTAGLLLAGCQGQEEPTQPQPTVMPTITPLRESTSEPSPTFTPRPTATARLPTPTRQDNSNLAKAIAEQWGEASPERVATLVTETILGSPAVENIPTLVKVQLQGVLEAQVVDEMGSGLTVSLTEVAYHGDSLFGVTFLVTGTVAVDRGPVEAVDVGVPIILTVDVGSQQVEDSQVDLTGVEVTIR